MAGAGATSMALRKEMAGGKGWLFRPSLSARGSSDTLFCYHMVYGLSAATATPFTVARWMLT